MQAPNQFNQFMTSGPMNQFPGPNPAMFNTNNFPNNPMNPQFQQFNTQQFPNPQMQLPGMQPQMPPMQGGAMGMNVPQGGPGGPQQNMGPPPPKKRLIVKLENNERGFYSTLMSQVDPEDLGKVDGKQSVPFFKRSGLPVDVLKKIWLIASTNNQTLDKEEFYVALRLIAYAQNNIEVSPQSIEMNIKAPLPKFQQPPKPSAEVAPPANPQPTDASASNTAPLGNIPGPTQAAMSGGMLGGMPNNIPAMMPNNISGGMPGNLQGDLLGGMSGLQIQPPVQNDLLGGNMGNMGNMNMGGMGNMGGMNSMGGMGMPPIQGSLSSIPPPSQFESMSNSLVDIPPPVKNEYIEPPQQNLNVSGSALDEPHVTSEQLPDITPEYLSYYETAYAANDPSNKGLITQDEAKEIFGRSGLPNETLFKIWMFCDTGDKGCLDKPEFFLALHLLALSKKGLHLPDKLPLKFQMFLKDSKRTLPSKDYLLEKIRENQAMMHNFNEQAVPQEIPYHEPPQQIINIPQPSNNVNMNIDRVSEDIPLIKHDYKHSNSSAGNASYISSNILQQVEEHHRELIAAVSSVKEINSRILQEKADDIHKLNVILMTCQQMLEKLRHGNDYIQNQVLPNQAIGVSSTPPVSNRASVAVKTNLAPAGGSGLFGSSPQKPVKESPQKPMDVFGKIESNMNMEGVAGNFEQNVDFQKEFAGEWSGFDGANAGGGKSNFEEFNF